MVRSLGLGMAPLALWAGVALLPGSVLAGQLQDRAGGGRVVHDGRFAHRPFVAPPVFFPHGVTRPFVHRFFFFPSPVFVYAAPAVVYAPPVYASPPAVYVPPVAYGPRALGAVSVAPAPMPTVVEYPTGRYELRGDGIAMPYTWVWIPNPPPAPPVAPPMLAPPSPAPERHGRLYRWLDADGVAHWTDRLDAVPERYRAQARSAPG